MPSASRRILVVDDNFDVATSIVSLLEELGQEVNFSLDPSNVPTLVRSFRPKIVFLDIAMPVMDGYQLAEALRREHGFDELRIVAVTGLDSGKERLSREVGFDAHIKKPVEIASLESVLQEFNEPA